MTSRSALPETVDDDLCDEDAAVLLPLLAQLRQVRSDQREALRWLAEHADGRA
jgi:hypothetical protein